MPQEGVEWVVISTWLMVCTVQFNGKMKIGPVTTAVFTQYKYEGWF
jgi:hypothetical protein